MATIMSAFAPEILQRVNDLLGLDNVNALGFTDEIKKLQNYLKDAVEMVSIAENNQREPTAKVWISKLRETMYAFEDFIDLCMLEVNKKPARSLLHLHVIPQLFGMRSAGNGMRVINYTAGNEIRIIKNYIETLKRKMDEIVDAKDLLAQQPGIANSTYRSVDILNTSEINLGDKRLFDLLLDDDTVPVLFIAITGVAGSGKTTLARTLYDDQRIVSAFHTLLWVSALKEYDTQMLQSAIIAKAEEKTKEPVSPCEYGTCLSQLLGERRTLIVLDGVWQGQISVSLQKTLFKSGGHGSRVLITTRDGPLAMQMKAQQMNAVHILPIRRLTNDEGWSLLLRSKALVSNEVSQLKENGDLILQKCDYLPLAINIIGGLLSTRNGSAEWKEILDSQGWSFKELPEENNPLIAATCVGYEDLSPNLKQCFLYCSLFPPSSVIPRDIITRLWISEGLVESNNRMLEENAQQHCREVNSDQQYREEKAQYYYMQLLNRGLLQPVPGDTVSTKCTIHDSVWSFSQFLTKEEICSSEQVDNIDPSVRIRRLFVRKKGLTFVPEEIGRFLSMRTLNFYGNPIASYELDEVFNRFKHLRVLDLTATQLEGVPLSLEKLVHLRHLDFSRTRITELPESIEKLEFLQYLGLQSCKWLYTLPKTISKLTCLTSLDLRDTLLEVVPTAELKRLTNLTKLHGFLVDKSDNCKTTKPTWNGWPLENLKDMSNLMSLQLLNAEKILFSERARYGVQDDWLLLLDKKYLKDLEIFGATEAKDGEIMESNIRRLHFPQCLESLKIVNFCRLRQCFWVLEQSLPNLKRLYIINCKFPIDLPALGELPQLEYLRLERASCTEINMTDSGHEFPAFPKLQELYIKDMEHLVSWMGFKEIDLPQLSKLKIKRCYQLKYPLEGLKCATGLTELLIQEIGSLEAVEDLPKLSKLEVKSCDSLLKIKKLPALKVLVLKNCSNLKSVSLEYPLCHVFIEDEKMEELPEWLERNASNLEALNILGNEKLLKRSLPKGIIVEDARAYVHQLGEWLNHSMRLATKNLPCNKDLFNIPLEKIILLTKNTGWPAIAKAARVYAHQLPDKSSFFVYTSSVKKIRRREDVDQSASSAAASGVNWERRAMRSMWLEVPLQLKLVQLKLVPYIILTIALGLAWAFAAGNPLAKIFILLAVPFLGYCTCFYLLWTMRGENM